MPVLITGFASWSEQRTTSRLLTIAARRSSSSSHQPALGEAVERELHHADGALDDLRARRDHRLGLLAAQHRAGDLGRVGEVGELGVVDHDARPARSAAAAPRCSAADDLVGARAQRDLGVARRAPRGCRRRSCGRDGAAPTRLCVTHVGLEVLDVEAARARCPRRARRRPRRSRSGCRACRSP